MFILDSFVDIFTAARAYCQERVAEATYDIFFKDLTPISFEENTALIGVRSSFIKGILEERYHEMFTQAFQQLFGFEVAVAFLVMEEEAPKKDPVLAGGNYDYTFDNFIVGQNNKFAHAAALSVAATPSQSWNPLFIYGASGLGKTHLLFAIQCEIAATRPDLKISYIDGDRFTNEIIDAIRDKKMNEVHNKYRTVDVLLVDDVQFIGGKESTQEEFFHTFNALHNEGKQIVLASDRPPREIRSLDDRLRTRFEWGLTADIQSPDFETRVAIIRRKASLLELAVPEEVEEYIATRIKDNIRQLEGTVKNMKARFLLEGTPPSIHVAQDCIKDIMTEARPLPVTIEKIIEEVARTYNVMPEDIMGRKRQANISTARMVAMYCVREITGLSMEDTGKEFGGRDHSTVVYSTGKVSSLIQTDMHMKETIEDIIKNVRN